MAGDDLNSSLIVPLIKRGTGKVRRLISAVLAGRGHPIAEELAGELYVFYGFDLAFDSQEKGENTRMKARAPGTVASSQQSHLAKLRHTEPGAQNPGCSKMIDTTWRAAAASGRSPSTRALTAARLRAMPRMQGPTLMINLS